MALGEQHPGFAGTSEDFLFVEIGTGIGHNIVVSRELYRSVDGCTGDIGHIPVEEFGPTCACGNTGCLEAFFGGAAPVAARDGGGDLGPVGRMARVTALGHAPLAEIRGVVYRRSHPLATGNLPIGSTPVLCRSWSGRCATRAC